MATVRAVDNPVPSARSGLEARLTFRGTMRGVLRAVTVGAVLTAVLFSIWELAEQMLFAGREAQALSRLHLARGILSALVVATVVAWTILRRSPGLLAETGAARVRLKPSGLAEAERTILYARWFIAMRWMAVLVALILLIISGRMMNWIPPSLRLWMLGLVAVLAASNLLYTLFVRRGWAVGTVLQVQGYADLAILTALLHFSGGVENPLGMLMLLHVIIGGILLSQRQCYGLAAVGSALFGLMGWAEWSGFLGHHSLLLWPRSHLAAQLFHEARQPLYVAGRVVLQTTMMFLIAYFVTTIAGRLRRHEQHLRTLAEEARAEQQLLEQALDTTGTALRVQDRELKPIWANERWHHWLGAAEAQLKGTDAPARQCLKDGLGRVTEITLERTVCCPGPVAGGLVPQCVFQITTAPLTDETGQIRQIVELAEDITQLKETQARMVRAGKLAALGELAGGVVHEVNNPITIISGKARLLLAYHQSEMSPRVAQELGKMVEMADRVARLAQGLLSAGRPSASGRVRLDVCGPIRKCLAMVEAQSKRLGVGVEDALPPNLPPVLANRAEVEQVFLNLFLNALDAMPHGGRMRVSSSAPPPAGDGPRLVSVAVEDSGPGVPLELRERIFEPFFTTKEEGRGTGLGLSICRGLVRSHEGEIEVEDGPGQGARFVVKLPVADQHEPEQRHG